MENCPLPPDNETVLTETGQSPTLWMTRFSVLLSADADVARNDPPFSIVVLIRERRTNPPGPRPRWRVRIRAGDSIGCRLERRRSRRSRELQGEVHVAAGRDDNRQARRRAASLGRSLNAAFGVPICAIGRRHQVDASRVVDLEEPGRFLARAEDPEIEHGGVHLDMVSPGDLEARVGHVPEDVADGFHLDARREVSTRGTRTASAPSVGVFAASTYGKVQPPSVESRMLTCRV